MQDGIAHYEKALSIGFIAPIDRRKELANLYLLSGDRAKAVELLNGIVHQDPAHVEARYRLGELASAAGNSEAAIAFWERTLELGIARPHSRDEELLGLAALAVADDHARKGDIATAERLYEEASTRLPNDPRPLLAWSALEARSGVGAESHLAVEASPCTEVRMNCLVRNNLGGLLLRDGKWKEAKEQYQRLAELRPADAQIRYTLGVAQARTGDPVAAQESLVQALRLDPNHARAKQALDLLMMDQQTHTGS